MIPLIRIENPIPCTIIRRENRFTVIIEVDNKRYKAWINNTGRLKEYLRRGLSGFCIVNEGEKNDYRLFAISSSDNMAVIIDTLLQMKAFEESIENKLLSSFKRCRIIRRNVTLYNSKIDYLLSCNSKSIYLEVKSAVLKGKDYAMYPDCPSIRGQKHIIDLIRNVEDGRESAIMFIAAIPDIRYFAPFKEGDPVIYSLIYDAYRKGVSLYSMQIVYDINRNMIMLLNGDIPIFPSEE